MSTLKILGVLALAGFTGLISLHVFHALWNVEIDGQTMLLALAGIMVPTCVGLRIKYNL